MKNKRMKGLTLFEAMVVVGCVAIIALLVGVFTKNKREPQTTAPQVTSTDDRLTVECLQGVGYVVFDGYKKGGVTVAYDRDGNIYRCPDVK